MGTRNLTCAVIDNDYKVAQFGQWDGYPSGQGITILTFLRDIMDRPTLEEKLRKLSFYTNEELEKLNEEIQNGTKKFPKHISRDIGGDILEVIQTGKWTHNEYDEKYRSVEVVHELDISQLKNELDFAADSLFCEYAYVVDFDKNTFEVYKGFVKSPHKGERFSDMDIHKSNGDSQYYPVKHWKTFDLNDLPSNEVFLEELDENEEE